MLIISLLSSFHTQVSRLNGKIKVSLKRGERKWGGEQLVGKGDDNNTEEEAENVNFYKYLMFVMTRNFCNQQRRGVSVFLKPLYSSFAVNEGEER